MMMTFKVMCFNLKMFQYFIKSYPVYLDAVLLIIFNSIVIHSYNMYYI